MASQTQSLISISLFNWGSGAGQSCVWVQTQSEWGDSAARGRSDQNRRRELGTGSVWLSKHSERSSGEREVRHNDTSLAALDGEDHHGNNQAHKEQKVNRMGAHCVLRQMALICFSLMAESSPGDAACSIQLISIGNHLYWPVSQHQDKTSPSAVTRLPQPLKWKIISV